MGECSDASVSEQNRDDSYWNEGKIGQGRHVSARLVLHRSCVLVSPTHEVEKRDDEPDEDGNPKENLFSSRGKERRYRGSGHLRAPQRLLTHARLPPGWPGCARGCADLRPAFVGGGARREARTTHGTRGQCATRCAASDACHHRSPTVRIPSQTHSPSTTRHARRPATLVPAR